MDGYPHSVRQGSYSRSPSSTRSQPYQADDYSDDGRSAVSISQSVVKSSSWLFQPGKTITVNGKSVKCLPLASVSEEERYSHPPDKAPEEDVVDFGPTPDGRHNICGVREIVNDETERLHLFVKRSTETGGSSAGSRLSQSGAQSRLLPATPELQPRRVEAWQEDVASVASRRSSRTVQPSDSRSQMSSRGGYDDDEERMVPLYGGRYINP